MYLLQVCTSASKFALLGYGIMGAFALAGVVAGVAGLGLGIYSVLKAPASPTADGDMNHLPRTSDPQSPRMPRHV